MPSTVPFKDLSLSFAKNKVTDDLLVKKEDAAVKQAILNLLLTEKGERLYNAQYGSDLRSHLFEPLDFGTAGSIKDSIIRTIRNYEPRVGDIGVEVDARPDSNTMEVKVLFEIVGIEAPVQSFSFILEPTR